MKIGRVERAVLGLLAEWHPQWLTVPELRLLDSTLGVTPAPRMREAVRRLSRRGMIDIDSSHSQPRLYWRESSHE